MLNISVSPPRKFEQETVESTPIKRYVIKQTVIAGSISTIGGSSSTFPSENGRHQNGRQNAPRIGFGDDDSPRVEYLPYSHHFK